MSRMCDICGKAPMHGGSICRRGMSKKKGGVGLNITGTSKRVFNPNVQSVRIRIGEESFKIKACTRCIKAGKTISVAK
ncbi:MAG: 50S ribosomal protein L28 [Candidatus Delongbacteria bacterium]|nr:50S ribosomal protein L28 [Candidatus Delongbacteria bacterium]MBN2834603.1 50S ribosomal protein L28 [Candidatus Delongbacteria bacterium]